MQFKQFFLAEFDREMPNVRKMLERVPGGKFDWKPHDKSMILGNLAGHIATLPIFVSVIVETDVFNMTDWTNERYPITRDELLAKFDEVTSKGRAAVEKADEEHFEKPWTFMYGDKTLSALLRSETLQSFFMNHLVHHRAQLGVYLRLLDVAIPGTYGPSADEQ